MKRRTFLAGVAAAALMPAPTRALFFKMKNGRMMPLRPHYPGGGAGIPGVYRTIPGRHAGIPSPFGGGDDHG